MAFKSICYLRHFPKPLYLSELHSAPRHDKPKKKKKKQCDPKAVQRAEEEGWLQLFSSHPVYELGAGTKRQRIPGSNQPIRSLS